MVLAQDPPIRTPVPGSAGMRERLRLATQPAHCQLHHHPLLEGLIGPALTAPHYRAILAALWGFHAPCDQLLAGAMPPRSPRSPLLAADLRTLGVDAEALAALPQVTPPSLERPAQRLGLRYVLDGSILGGKVIAVRLKHNLGIGAETGGGFFASAGLDAENQWGIFVATLDSLLPSEPARAEAVTAALAAFAALDQWLDFLAGQTA